MEEVSQVISIILTVIGSKGKIGNDRKKRAFQISLVLARVDKRVFDFFRPKPALLSTLRLHEYAMLEDADLSAQACEFISFLMRYNPQIDYVTFSDDAEFVRRVRRFEGVKYAAELEQLTIKIVELENRQALGGGGSGGHVDDVFLEARIHDKVREAVESSAIGEGSINKISSVE